MRKAILLLGAIMAFAIPAKAHTVTLSWTLSTDDTSVLCAAPSTCSQTVYRAPGACSSSSVFSQLGTLGANTTTFVDSTVTPGTYCYATSFTLNGSESTKDTVTVILPPSSPSGISAVPN